MFAPMGNRLQGRPPTIRDIAREAGVSVATISRVLNRQPHVAPETRAAVLRVVRERGFSQNRSARALSGAPTGLVGVTLPYIRASYSPRSPRRWPTPSTSRTCGRSCARPSTSTSERWACSSG